MKKGERNLVRIYSPSKNSVNTGYSQKMAGSGDTKVQSKDLVRIHENSVERGSLLN